MQALGKTLVGTAILASAGSACVDAAKSFQDFDERVIDAAPSTVGGSCNGGEIPDVDGEFFLALSPSVSPDALLRFVVTTDLDLGEAPPLLNLTLQPICTQSGQCTVGQPVGDPVVLDAGEVADDCSFSLVLTDVFIPGGANTISGSDIIGNLDLLGSLRNTDFYCGLINGTATVGGANIPIEGSTFGSIRIAEGTLGDDLPDPVAACPVEVPEFDAGVPDAGPADAGPADAGPADADVADAGILDPSPV